MTRRSPDWTARLGDSTTVPSISCSKTIPPEVEPPRERCNVFRRLIPKETSFFEFFEGHMALTLSGAKEFVGLVTGTGGFLPAAKRIKEIEHEADTVTHRCVEVLRRTFITPIDRDDIHRLISRMDDIMDYLEAAAERISLYEITEMTPEVRELARLIVKATETLYTAVRGLRDLRHAEPILKACVDVNRLENEADTILRIAIARLFKETEDPITIIKWKEIYEDLENATDRCEDVANIIENFVLDYA
ncbi:MAG: DUF47 domain-containing protein [Planctomycetota bacterium]